MKMRVQGFQYYLTLYPTRAASICTKPLSVEDGLKALGIEMLRIIRKEDEQSIVAVEFKGNSMLTSKQSKGLYKLLTTEIPNLELHILLEGSLLIAKNNGREYGFFFVNCKVSKWEIPVTEVSTPKHERKRMKAEAPSKQDPPTVKKEEPSGKEDRRQSMHVDSLISLREMAINSPLPESTKSSDTQYTYETVVDAAEETEELSVD